MVIQQYQDPTFKRWLKIGFWYQAHKEIFFKSIIGALIAVNVGFWGYTFYGITRIIIDSKNDSQLYAELVQERSQVLDLHEARAPKNLIINDIFTVLSSSADLSSSVAVKTDFVAIAENPSASWIMDVEYSFSWASKRTETGHTQVLPGRKMPLAVFGVDVLGLPSDVNIETDITWHRVKDDVKLERAYHALDSLVIMDSQITSRSGISDVKIEIENQGIYTIIDPGFLILLSSFTGKYEGIGFIQAQTFASKSSMEIEKRWLRRLSQNLQIQVFPKADLLDNSIYRLP